MKITLQKDWYDDAVHVKVDGEIIGAIYGENVSGVAHVLSEIIKRITTPETVLEIVEL